MNLYGCEGTCVHAEQERVALSVGEPLAAACEPLPKEEACGRLARATGFPFP